MKTIIPEEIFIECIKSINNGDLQAESICPECGNKIIEKRTKKGKIFYGCSNYPTCKYATWKKPE